MLNLMSPEPRPTCTLAKLAHLPVEPAAAQAVAAFTGARLLVGTALFHAQHAQDTPNLLRISQAEQIEVIVDHALRAVFEFAKQQFTAELKFVRTPRTGKERGNATQSPAGRGAGKPSRAGVMASLGTMSHPG